MLLWRMVIIIHFSYILLQQAHANDYSSSSSSLVSSMLALCSLAPASAPFTLAFLGAASPDSTVSPIAMSAALISGIAWRSALYWSSGREIPYKKLAPEIYTCMQL